MLNQVCVFGFVSAICCWTAVAQHQDLMYILQPDNVSVEQLTDSDVDWLILEPTVEGSQNTAFSAVQIEQIRSQGACPKKVLAYLSVGEAESYRDYFDPAWVDANDNPVPGAAPDWLGATNPDWEGNYKVRYWMPDWQRLIIGTDAGPHVSPLDAIIDAGFDGVYLDIIDAYYYWSSTDGVVERPRMQARDEMISMVQEIARHARVVRGVSDFMVFPQGGSDIIRNDDDGFDARTDDYFSAINGIGREDVWFNELAQQAPEETSYTLDQLREYQSRGGTVLITDYLIKRSNQSASQNNERATEFRNQILTEGFIGYSAFNDRELDKIVTFSGSNWTVEQPELGCAPTVCIADFNDDAVLDFFDVSAFLAEFSAQTPQADLTGDGSYDFFDISAFLTAFAAGCP